MSDYTGREMDIMYREAFEAGQEQGRADMAHIVAERDQLAEDRRELMKALEWYADKKNWHNDDWGILAVVAPPDYDDCGLLARATIDRIKAREGKGE